MVENNWDIPIYASPLEKLVGKLKRWNISAFGNVLNNVAVAEDAVLVAQQAFDEDPNNEHLHRPRKNSCIHSSRVRRSWRQRYLILLISLLC